MNSKEFGVLATAIKTYFPRDNILPTERSLELWYDALKDLSYDVANAALKIYVYKNKFPPAIADIREQAAIILNQENEINELTAWGLVIKAMRNSGYNAEEEFAKLPEIIQKTIGTADQLREWALMENSDRSMPVLQSNFMRTFRSVLNNEKELRKMSPELLKIIGRELQKYETLPVKPSITVSEERETALKNKTPPTESTMDKINFVKRKLTNEMKK